MIGKLALVLGVSLLALPAQAQAPGIPYEAVKQVMCPKSRGSAFRVRGGTYVTAAHVLDAGCSINGVPITGTVEDGLDFAVITGGPAGGLGFKVNCGGFIPGQWYYAVGYGAGFPWRSMTRMVATTLKTEAGLVALRGWPTVIPGYSGGVMLTPLGEAVGVINQFTPYDTYSMSRSLSETSLCRNSDSARP